MEPEEERIGNYRLLRKIATGGMAEIFRAENEGPEGFNKSVVIKRILPHLAADPIFVDMFLDEARLVAQLSHPKIAQIYTLGQEGDDYFIAMEFIDGVNLNTIIERCRDEHQYIPSPIALRIVSDVLDALYYAHNFTDAHGVPQGIVHRDVTPHNILISKDGVVKLADFGVAKAAQQHSKTQTGAVKGKFSYMAPEQISGDPVDARTDLFEVGIVLYELLTLVKPFGEDLAAVAAVRLGKFESPRKLRREIPFTLADVVRRSLEPKPEDRFQDADEMRRAIEDVLRTEFDFVSDRDMKSFYEAVTADRLNLNTSVWIQMSAASSLQTTAQLGDVNFSVRDITYKPTFSSKPSIPSVERSTRIDPDNNSDTNFSYDKKDDLNVSTETLKPTSTSDLLVADNTDDKKENYDNNNYSDLDLSDEINSKPKRIRQEADGKPINVKTFRTKRDLLDVEEPSYGFVKVGTTLFFLASLIAAIALAFLLYQNFHEKSSTLTSSQLIEKNDDSDVLAKAAIQHDDLSQSRNERTEGIFDYPRGRFVRILRHVSIPLYYKQQPLGETPIQTRLKPGGYSIEYSEDGKIKKFYIDVKNVDGIQTFFMDDRQDLHLIQ